MTIKKGDIVLLDDKREGEVIAIAPPALEGSTISYFKVKLKGIFGKTVWVSHYYVVALIEARS
jgi:hypothetical protein